MFGSLARSRATQLSLAVTGKYLRGHERPTAMGPHGILYSAPSSNNPLAPSAGWPTPGMTIRRADDEAIQQQHPPKGSVLQIVGYSQQSELLRARDRAPNNLNKLPTCNTELLSHLGQHSIAQFPVAMGHHRVCHSLSLHIEDKDSMLSVLSHTSQFVDQGRLDLPCG